MYKKTISYEDFDGNARVEDKYFNLTKSELIEFALNLPDNVSGSMVKGDEKIDETTAMTKIMSAFNSKGLFQFIKDLILKSYGERRDEGRRFAKKDENGNPLYIAFSETMAFEAIMDEFMNNDVAAAEFVNAVIPSSLADQMPNVQNLRQAIPANN